MKKAISLLAFLLTAAFPAWGETGKGDDGNGTRVTISGNHVLVPVALTYAGKTVRATFMLDTGASSTLISKTIAKSLHLDLDRASPTRFQVVGGGMVQGWHTKLDRVEVGGQSRSGLEVAVVVESGSFPFDGLLGMDFLRDFRYSLDFKNQLIKLDQP